MLLHYALVPKCVLPPLCKCKKLFGSNDQVKTFDRMANNSEATSLSYSESISAVTTGVVKCHNENVSAEEVSLLGHLQRGISETTEENVVLTKEITSLLSKLNLEIKTFPSDIKEGLEKLSLVLKSERLLEFDETALRIAKEQKIIKEKRQQREEKQISLMYDKLLKNYTKLQMKLDHLQNAVDTLKDTIDDTEKNKDSLYCNKIFLSTKLEEYEQAVKKLEADLSGMQVDELYPEKILDKYNFYLERKNKLANLNQSLTQYGELPPNLLQAELLVESKRKEYENLEQLFLQETH